MPVHNKEVATLGAGEAATLPGAPLETSTPSPAIEGQVGATRGAATKILKALGITAFSGFVGLASAAGCAKIVYPEETKAFWGKFFPGNDQGLVTPPTPSTATEGPKTEKTELSELPDTPEKLRAGLQRIPGWKAPQTLPNTGRNMSYGSLVTLESPEGTTGYTWKKIMDKEGEFGSEKIVIAATKVEKTGKLQGGIRSYIGITPITSAPDDNNPDISYHYYACSTQQNAKSRGAGIILTSNKGIKIATAQFVVPYCGDTKGNGENKE